MKHASLSGESSWKNRKSESGIKEKRTSKDFKMRDSIYCNQP
jgi:hypothetical protein